jgi:tetratricopeptide (TPR) repeat protein
MSDRYPSLPLWNPNESVALVKSETMNRRAKSNKITLRGSHSFACLAIVFMLVITTITFRVGGAKPTRGTSRCLRTQKGDYENAIKLLNARLASNANDNSAEANLLRALIETGRYLDAENSAKKFLLKNPGAGPVHHQLAEVLVITGRYNEDITTFERAVQSTNAPPEKLESELRRAEVNLLAR